MITTVYHIILRYNIISKPLCLHFSCMTQRVFVNAVAGDNMYKKHELKY